MLVRILCSCALAGLLFPSSGSAQPGEDEIDQLKAEIANLRAENAQLKKELERFKGPEANFEQVLWLQGEDNKKSQLYLVVSVRDRDPSKLGAYATAAVKEVEKAPVKDPMVVFVLRGTEPPRKGATLLVSVPDMAVGMSAGYLQRVAAAPPEKRGAMFLVPAWTPGGVPKEAKPLQ